MSNPELVDGVAIGKVFLDLENPRFEVVGSQREAIEILCDEELVLPLAQDIAEIGLNPLERFALVPTKGSKKGPQRSYFMAEGNRRLCAIMLLNDPELAPAKYKARFMEAAANWTAMSELSGVVFENKEAAKPWLQRIHQSGLEGKGRKSWNSEQQERFSGGGRNQLAQAFLDDAQERGLISPAERRNKITTVQRYVSNPDFRDSIGLDKDNAKSFALTRPEADYVKLAKRFIDDMLKGEEVSSRKGKDDIAAYGRRIVEQEKISDQRMTPAAAEGSGRGQATKPRRTKPTPPKKPAALPHSRKIELALRELDSYKLQSLYHSITKLDLEDHTPLLAVGLWSFVDSLTANLGRLDRDSFSSFFSNDRLASLGYSDRSLRKPMPEMLRRVQDYGNNTKHHALGGAFDAKQLYNDMEVLTELLERVVNKAVEAKRQEEATSPGAGKT